MTVATGLVGGLLFLVGLAGGYLLAQRFALKDLSYASAAVAAQQRDLALVLGMDEYDHEAAVRLIRDLRETLATGVPP